MVYGCWHVPVTELSLLWATLFEHAASICIVDVYYYRCSRSITAHRVPYIQGASESYVHEMIVDKKVRRKFRIEFSHNDALF